METSTNAAHFDPDAYCNDINETIKSVVGSLKGLQGFHFVYFPKTNFNKISKACRRNTEFPTFKSISFVNDVPIACFGTKEDADKFTKSFNYNIHGSGSDFTSKIPTVDIKLMVEEMPKDLKSAFAESLQAELVSSSQTQDKATVLCFRKLPEKLMFFPSDAINIGNQQVITFEWSKKVNCLNCSAPGHLKSQCTLNEMKVKFYKQQVELKLVYFRSFAYAKKKKNSYIRGDPLMKYHEEEMKGEQSELEKDERWISAGNKKKKFWKKPDTSFVPPKPLVNVNTKLDTTREQKSDTSTSQLSGSSTEHTVQNQDKLKPPVLSSSDKTISNTGTGKPKSPVSSISTGKKNISKAPVSKRSPNKTTYTNREVQALSEDLEHEWEVDKILAWKVAGNKGSFQIKWKPYDDTVFSDSWEPMEMITNCTDLIEKFFASRPNERTAFQKLKSANLK